MTNNNDILLKVSDLRTYFRTDGGFVKAVDGVSFAIPRGKTFAVVGESGCGKSVTAFSIMQLLSMPPALITGEMWLRANLNRIARLAGPSRDEMLAVFGNNYRALGGQAPADTDDVRGLEITRPSRIEFEGTNLLDLDDKQMRSVRGGRIGMIFQEPMTSLNPVYTCGSQIIEAVRIHSKVSATQARAIGVELLAKVGIPEPAQRFEEYPHQLSGGMRQRVMIAMALSCNPRLLIADEPTTALDVTIQAQILELLRQIQQDSDLSIMLITHDLAVVAETAHTVSVMYAGKMVETTTVETLFASPLHPYTTGLFRSLPRLGEQKHRLETISGNVPSPLKFPTGCKFHTRCPLTRKLAAGADAKDALPVVTDSGVKNVLRRCAAQEPGLREVRPSHWCACWEVEGYEAAPSGDVSVFTG